MAGENGGTGTPTTTGDPNLDAMISALRSGQGATSSGSVYFGMKSKASNRDDGAAYAGRAITENALSGDEATSQFFRWSDTELQAWGQRLYRSGLISNPGDYQQMYRAWSDACKLAANYYAAGRKITPWEVIDLQTGLAGASGSGGPKTTRNVSRSLNIPTAAEADAITRQMFQDLLGRDPTDGEFAKYRSLLIGKAKENPSVTTTITNTDGSGNSTQSSTTTGGFTSAMAQEAVRGQATQDPEYGTYLAATTYMQALQQAMGAPV